MQRRADRFVEVELVEDDAADDDGPRGDALHDGLRHGDVPRRWLRSVAAGLPREVALTAVAAVLLAGAGVAVARVGEERALDARLAEVPGLMPSLAEPLRVDWRVPGGGLVATLDDVVWHWDADGFGVVATDLDDGSTRYSASGMCQLAPTEGDLADRYTLAGPSSEARPGDVLLCVHGNGTGRLGGVRAAESAADVVDPATGRTLHTITMRGAETWDVVDGDVVSIGLDAERRVVAGRWSLRTGEQRWAHHGTDVAPDGATGWGSTMSTSTMGLEVGTWSVTLDLETGAETRPPAGGGVPELDQRVQLADGGYLEHGTSRSGRLQTTVHPADGGEPVTMPGIVPPLAVDDGSVPGALPVFGAEAAAGDWAMSMVELGSGDVRWTADVQGGEVAVLSGVVLVADPVRTVALDARTGETRWESTSGSTAFFGWEVVTDGRRVLVVAGGPDGDGEGSDGGGADGGAVGSAGAGRPARDAAAPRIVARDVRTGERLWSIDPPVEDGILVPLPDGTVLVVGSSEVAALRR